MKRFVTAAALLALLPGAGAAQHFPATPPAPGPIRPAVFPEVAEARLDNGLRVAVVERDVVPLVSMSLTFPAGAAYESPDRKGTAQIVSDVLTKGTAEHTAEEIAARIENVGGQIGVGLDNDFMTVFVTVLPRYAELAMETLAEVSRRATFPDAEIELARSRLSDALTLVRTQPRAVAEQFLAQRVYGADHPYGQFATPASVAAIDRGDLLAFRDLRLRPEHALLVMTGSLSPGESEALARRFLGGDWRRPGTPVAGAPQKVAPTGADPSEILLVHRPGSSQSVVLAGNIAPAVGSPSAYALEVANAVLGGGAQSRLFKVLREQKGWTYGAYSTLEAPLGPGLFNAGAEVRTEVTDSALVELLAQIDAMRASAPAEEVARARAGITGAFPLTVQTVGQLNTRVRTILGTDRPLSHLAEYRQRIAAVTPQEVRGAAAAYFRPDRGAIVVVGDGNEVLEPLRAIGPVRVVDVHGQPVDPASLGKPAAALPVDPARLHAFADSFTVQVQGNAVGAQKVSARKEGAGWVLVDDTRIGAAVSQVTTVELAPDLALTAIQQEGSIQGMAVGMRAAVADGRVTGWSAVPTPQGVDSAGIDIEAPAGLTETAALPLLVRGLPLEEGATWTFSALDAATRTVKPYALTVTGSGTTTTPAGTFPTWRAELQGGAQTVVFHISRDGDQRVVRVEIQGAPVEFVLAGTGE